MRLFNASLPNWAMLAGCFGSTKIRPTDVDGCVERNGFMLFLECKGLGVEISDAQLITFRAMAAQGNTVIIFWADRDDVREMWVIRPRENLGRQDTDLDGLRKAVSEWFAWANSRRWKIWIKENMP